LWDEKQWIRFRISGSGFAFFVFLQSGAMCVFVCLCVCLSACISKKTTCPNLTNFSVHVNYGCGLSSSDDNATRYVSPVLWMTSCFHIMGQIQIQAWSLRCNDIILAERCNSSAHPTGCVCVSVSKARYTLPVFTGRDARVHGKCPRPVDSGSVSK